MKYVNCQSLRERQKTILLNAPKSIELKVFRRVGVFIRASSSNSVGALIKVQLNDEHSKVSNVRTVLCVIVKSLNTVYHDGHWHQYVSIKVVE